ncbi:MAG: Gfo/Idh/MocA family oxidoreductase [Acidobacteria bacterium]|nr:Gfo/Idh/MocA family oxidoreductase [Acidobacteriota bacterium]
MAKLGWGVLSTSKFARTKFLPAMQNCRFAEASAIASANAEKAREIAREAGIAKVYASYEELLADPAIEVVYNPLPNHLHVEWSIRALEAGKHVLCEKPIAMNAAEAEVLLEASKRYPKLKIMEAFMYRHHPQWRRAKQIVDEGGIGEMRTVQSFFSYYNLDPENIRNRADIGGGGMMDIGCYCVSLSRFLFGAEPERVSGAVEYDPDLGIDRLASGLLDFGRGTAIFTCSTQVSPYQRVNICGTKGRVEIEIPFNAPPDRPCRIWHETAGGIEEIVFEICDQYTIEADLFSRAVLDDTAPPTPIEDAVANMRVIDAIRER